MNIHGEMVGKETGLTNSQTAATFPGSLALTKKRSREE